MPSGESVEPLRFADDDDSDDLGGFSRGKRSYDDDEDEDGGWAINEDHSDRLWDSAEDADDDDEADPDAVVVGESDDGDDEDEEEEEDDEDDKEDKEDADETGGSSFEECGIRRRGALEVDDRPKRDDRGRRDTS